MLNICALNGPAKRFSMSAACPTLQLCEIFHSEAFSSMHQHACLRISCQLIAASFFTCMLGLKAACVALPAGVVVCSVSRIDLRSLHTLREQKFYERAA